MALDRAHVVKTAIALMDEVGLDGLTLRRLAADLGVQAPALYWHFTNKQELLDQMAYTLHSTEAPMRHPEPGETWDEWLADRGRQMRAVMNSHRDAAMLAASTHPQPHEWPDIEAELEILCGSGLTAADAMRAMIAVGNYVSGFTLEEQADRMRDSDPPPDAAQFEAFLERMRDYPRLVEALREIGDPQSDTSFEAGLRLIIDGIRTRVAAPPPG